MLIESLLADELVKEIGGLTTPETATALYEEVSIRQRNARRYLIAHGQFVGIFNPIQGAWDPDQGGYLRPIDHPFSVLFSLIALVKDPVQWEALDTCLPPQDARQWCLEHGLPEVEERDDDSYWLRLETFQRHTVTLALLFQCWYALVCKDWEQLDTVLIVLSDDPAALHGRTREWKQGLAQRILSECITDRIHRISPVMRWPLMKHGEDIRPDGTPRISLMTSSLFDYVFFQLAELIFKPETEVKQRLKLCQGCAQLFWGHGNRRYCARPGCDRRTIWSRKHRAGVA